MKKVIISLFFCFLLVPAIAWGAPQQVQPETDQVQQNISKEIPTAKKLEQIAPETGIGENSIAGMKDPDLVPMQRGCCSWHDGVCGCKNGRTVCCDGTYSPSCGC